MVAYKAGLKMRVALAWICVAALLAVALVMVFVLKVDVADDHLRGFIRGAQTGMFVVLLAKALLTALQYGRATRDDALLEKLFVAETDERCRLIRDKIGNVGQNLTLALLAGASVVAGYFDESVFITLFAATFVAAMVKGALKVYFTRKY